VPPATPIRDDLWIAPDAELVPGLVVELNADILAFIRE
jgi:hypothetical protein